jgi:hypothetical protein
MRTPKLGLSYVVKMFMLFFLAFAIVQALVYFLATKIFPYQIVVDVRGWVSQTTLLVFIEIIASAACAAILCVIYVQHIMGPLQRLIDEIKRMESHGECREIKIRTGDKLFGLVEAVNSVLSKYLKK